MPDAEEPRWIADEMLGRLTRFLRILGYDTRYVHGLADDQVREESQREGRILLTRDVRLAARTPGALLIRSAHLEGQLRELWERYPELSRVPRFTRCTKCNGPLTLFDLPAEGTVEVGGIAVRTQSVGPVYRCTVCGQPYWEGSHTRKVRSFLETAASGSVPR